jgi:hypothetical protein
VLKSYVLVITSAYPLTAVNTINKRKLSFFIILILKNSNIQYHDNETHSRLHYTYKKNNFSLTFKIILLVSKRNTTFIAY